MIQMIEVPDSALAISVTVVFERNGEIKMATQNAKASKDQMIIFTDKGAKNAES